MPRKMQFSYLKSISSSDEALFSGLGKEIKTKQILVFAGLAIMALIVVHRSVILAIPFFLVGIVYLNYSDDIMPLSNYLTALQEYRKLKPKVQKQKAQRKKERSIRLSKIPTEVQLVMVSVISMVSGFYGIYQSIYSINVIGIVVGSILVGLGLVILLVIVSPFLNRILNDEVA
ncbi:MAG: hypothetical protein QXO96_04950 [Sulfolobales archaeon]